VFLELRILKELAGEIVELRILKDLWIGNWKIEIGKLQRCCEVLAPESGTERFGDDGVESSRPMIIHIFSILSSTL